MLRSCEARYPLEPRQIDAVFPDGEAGDGVVVRVAGTEYEGIGAGGALERAVARNVLDPVLVSHDMSPSLIVSASGGIYEGVAAIGTVGSGVVVWIPFKAGWNVHGPGRCVERHGAGPWYGTRRLQAKV